MDEGSQVFPQGNSAALLVIEFPSFRDFIDAYSSIISEEGIFIRNEDVSESNAFAVGDQVDFEVRLKDDFRLIQGAGEVVWLGSSEAADGASGTAIRFHDVDEPSQRLISRLVGNYVRDGGTLFEVGGPTAESDTAPPATSPSEPPVAPPPAPITDLPPEPMLEVEAEQGLDVEPSSVTRPEDSRITAEKLKESEADALFARDDDAEHEAPLEFESVSLEDVEPKREGGALGQLPEVAKPEEPENPEPTGVSLDDPVGLETIAIPSGLVANLVSEAEKAAKAPDSENDSAEVAGDLGSEPEDAPAIPEAPAKLPIVDLPSFELPEVGLPGTDEGLAGAAAALAAAPDLDRQAQTPLGEDFDAGLLDPVAAEMESEVSGRVGIPDDIAQVAEELSGVHRVELPDPAEVSGVTYAGSASVQPERNTGSRIAALSVLFVLLGAGAFYFGDTILAFFGLGGDQDSMAATDMVRAGETMPAPVKPPVGGAPGSDAGVASDEAGGDLDAGEEASTTNPSGTESMPVEGTEEETDSPAVGSRNGDNAKGAEAAVPGAEAPAGLATPSGSTRVPAAQSSATVVTGASRASEASDPRSVESITWREEGDSTIVIVRLNTEASKARVEVVRVRDGAPREVIKILGIEVPYTPSEVPVASRHVLRLRTGLHRTGGDSALHVVADLTRAGVAVLSVETVGRDLKITFS